MKLYCVTCGGGIVHSLIKSWDWGCWHGLCNLGQIWHVTSSYSQMNYWVYIVLNIQLIHHNFYMIVSFGVDWIL
jgi:hypothetical protein